MRSYVSRFLIVVLLALAISETCCNRDKQAITNAEIEANLDSRMSYFVQLYGSKEKLEEVTGKSFEELRAEYRPVIATQLAAEQGK